MIYNWILLDECFFFWRGFQWVKCCWFSLLADNLCVCVCVFLSGVNFMYFLDIAFVFVLFDWLTTLCFALYWLLAIIARRMSVALFLLVYFFFFKWSTFLWMCALDGTLLLSLDACLCCGFNYKVKKKRQQQKKEKKTLIREEKLVDICLISGNLVKCVVCFVLIDLRARWISGSHLIHLIYFFVWNFREYWHLPNGPDFPKWVYYARMHNKKPIELLQCYTNDTPLLYIISLMMYSRTRFICICVPIHFSFVQFHVVHRSISQFFGGVGKCVIVSDLLQIAPIPLFASQKNIDESTDSNRARFKMCVHLNEITKWNGFIVRWIHSCFESEMRFVNAIRRFMSIK